MHEIKFDRMFLVLYLFNLFGPIAVGWNLELIGTGKVSCAIRTSAKNLHFHSQSFYITWIGLT